MTNQVVNFGFEVPAADPNKAADWTYDYENTGSAPSYSRPATGLEGQVVQRLTPPTAADGASIASKAIAVTAGQVWHLLARYRSTVNITSGVYFRVMWGTADGFARGAASSFEDPVANGPATTNWQEVVARVIVPAGATWMRLAMYRWITNVQASLEVDAFEAHSDKPEVVFSYTGAEQTWTVPDGVQEVQVDVQGPGISTRKGGRVQALVPVQSSGLVRANVGGSTGWNGGGAGGVGGAPAGGQYPAGAGASDIRLGGAGLSNRAAVAGGASAGADGGGLVGGAPGGARQGGEGYVGGPGTQSAGGFGGPGGPGGPNAASGAAGQLGSGGSGGNGATGGNGGGGGWGGGGGYYGGGGGGGGGWDGSVSWAGNYGAGGSSYASSACRAVAHQSAFRTGNGLIAISWWPRSSSQAVV